jgi:hypothetical protein
MPDIVGGHGPSLWKRAAADRGGARTINAVAAEATRTNARRIMEKSEDQCGGGGGERRAREGGESARDKEEEQCHPCFFLPLLWCSGLFVFNNTYLVEII